MLKKIGKRILKVFLWLIGIFIALDLLIVTLLFVPPVQQFVLTRVSRLLTNITGGEITMDKIYLSPRLTLTAKNFAIKDHRHENMIFATTLKGRIHFAKTGRGMVTLSFAELDNGEVVLRNYEGDDRVNIAIWAEGLKKTEKKDPKFKLLFENIALNDVRFVFINDEKRLFKDDNTIDYAFFELQHIFLNVDDFLVFGPDVSCKINSLTLSQYTGFEISSLAGYFRINAKGLTLDDLHFTTPNSTFSGNFAFRYNEFSDYADFVNKINFDTEVKTASVAMCDVVCFAPALQGMNDQFVLSGHVSGQVNHLKTTNFLLKYQFLTKLSGDFAIENVLDFKNSMVDFSFKNSYIDFAELTHLSLPKGNKIKLPEATKNITHSTINGNFTGTFTKFDTKLLVNTNLGTINTAIKTTAKGDKLNYSGTIAGVNLNMAKLLNQPNYLNKLTFRGLIDCNADNIGNFKDLLASLSLNLRGGVVDVDVCGYPFKHLAFSGGYSQKKMNFALMSPDSLAAFYTRGTLNFANEVPTVEASLVYVDMKMYEFFSHYPRRVDSNSVGFDKFVYKVQQMPNLMFTMDSISINMTGNRFENLNGFLGIDYAKVSNGVHTSRIDWLRLTAINTPNLPHQYQIHTNAFNVGFKTNYDFKDLMTVIDNAAHFYFPKMFLSTGQFDETKPVISLDSTQFVDVEVKLFYTRNIFDLVFPKFNITRDASVNVHLGKTRAEDFFNFSFPQITYADLGRVSNLKANGEINEQMKLKIDLQCDSVTLFQNTGNLTLANIGVNTLSSRDDVQFMTSWRNPRLISVNEKNILGGSLWTEEDGGFSLKVTHSELYLRESQWRFIGENNMATFGNNRMIFDNCVLYSDVGKISVNGEISKESDKDCNILLENVDISLLNSLIAKSGMSVGGNMSLMANISPQIDFFRVEGKTFVKDFVFNEEQMGDMFLDVELLNDGQPHFAGGILSSSANLNIDLPHFTYADYQSLPNKIVALNGKFLTQQKELRVRADIDTLNIGFLSPFLASFSNIITGEASGYLDFVMNRDSMYFNGRVLAKNMQMGITPLNTIYSIKNQEILFDRSGIDFERVIITDKFNNQATLSGYVHHNRFKDFIIDLNISTPRILILNTPRKIDDPFFGDGFVSGDISIQGDTRQLNFTSRNIKTLTGSSITFPLNSTSSVSSAQGIYFIQNKEVKETINEPASSLSTVLNFDFTFDITRDADVRLELDPIDGILKCRTAGRLNLTYNTNSGNMNLDGILSIVSGSFNMSLRNFFPRNFSIVEGGTITFAGPLTSAQINVSALYQRAASLSTLNSSLNEIGRTDVQAFLGLTGNLMNPIPSFTFAFPRLTDNQAIEVQTILDPDDQQNVIRQFFSFVFLNTFIADQTSIDDNMVIGTGFEMVSGILTSFISNQFNNFSFGMNYINNQGVNDETGYTPGYKEYSVNAQMRFLDDRIKVSTSMGYGNDLNSSQERNNNFVGDVDVEILLNDARNWILRLFYFNEVNPNPERPQQGGGVGISYRHEFNNRKDYMESWTPKKRENKKENKRKKDD